jgi:transcriptional regulator with XRE-family HTH domain
MSESELKSKTEDLRDDLEKAIDDEISKGESYTDDNPIKYADDPKQARDWARWAWLKKKGSVAQIAEAIEVSPTYIYRWIQGSKKAEGWAKTQENLDRRHLNRAIQTNSKRIHYVLNLMLDTLESSAQNLINNRHALTIGEFNQFTTAFEKLFKTRQLAMGRPTDIVEGEFKEISWHEVKQKLFDVDILDYKAIGQIGIKEPDEGQVGEQEGQVDKHESQIDEQEGQLDE